MIHYLQVPIIRLWGWCVMQKILLGIISSLVFYSSSCRSSRDNSDALSLMATKQKNRPNGETHSTVTISSQPKGILAEIKSKLDLENNCIALVNTPHGVNLNFYFLRCDDALIGPKSLRFRLIVDVLDKTSLEAGISFPVLSHGFAVGTLKRTILPNGKGVAYTLEELNCSLNGASSNPCSIYLDSGRFDKMTITPGANMKSLLTGWDEKRNRITCDIADNLWTNGSINPYVETCKGLGYSAFYCRRAPTAKAIQLCEAPVDGRYGSLGSVAEKEILSVARKALQDELAIPPANVTKVSSILFHPSGNRFVTISAKIDSPAYKLAWPVLQKAITALTVTDLDGRQWSLNDGFIIDLFPLCAATPCS